MLCVGFVDSEVKHILYFERERENIFKEPMPCNFVWCLQNPYSTAHGVTSPYEKEW